MNQIALAVVAVFPRDSAVIVNLGQYAHEATRLLKALDIAPVQYSMRGMGAIVADGADAKNGWKADVRAFTFF